MKSPNTQETGERTQHTPGPWNVTGDAGHPANIRITSTGRRHIAKVYAESIDRDLVCEANARLIAVAPKLLEACRMLVCALMPPGECEEEKREAMKLGCSAIAEAEGK